MENTIYRATNFIERIEMEIMVEFRYLFVTRREDLEIDSLEALWLETAVPKSRSFLIGTFYRPDRTSSYYDKDFMSKLNNILDTATAQNHQILLWRLPLLLSPSETV